MTPERRFLPASRVQIETRADKPSRITGYASVQYTGDADTEYELWRYGDERCVERVMAGCFSRALREKDDTRALFNHDPNHVLGRSSAGTLEMEEDKTGLKYSIDPPDTQFAKDLMASIARGDITGSSFSFAIESQKWSETKTDTGILIVRELHSVRLFDVSPVTFPAYEGATTGVRSSVDPKQLRAEYWATERRASRVRERYVQARMAEIESNL